MIKEILAVFILTGTLIAADGQQNQNIRKPDTAYFTITNRKTPHRDSAEFYTVRTYSPEDSNRVRMTKHAMNGRLLAENYFSDFKRLIKDGISREYFPDAVVAKEVSYIRNKMDGPFITYWPDGTIRRRDLYRNDSLINGQCYTRAGKDTSYFVYDEKPAFPGGQDSLRKYLWQHIKYPPEARHQEIQGTVYVRFKVEKDGTIAETELLKGVSPLLDAEAIRVVKKMPPWIPRKLDGETTAYYLALPVTFIIN